MIVITPKAKFGTYKQVDQVDGGLLCDGALLPFAVIGETFEISTDDTQAPAPIVIDTRPVPAAVTMRQARLALLQAGKLNAVNAAIASMPGVQGEAARIEWEFSNEVQRAQPLVAALAPVLGMTSSQLDQLFITAAGL